MAGMFRRLAVLATAAEAARRYARSNPEQAGRYLDQAASFVDKQTKGKYRTQIDGVTKKAKSVAGIPAPIPGHPQDNGHLPGEGPTSAYGTPGYPAPQPGPRTPGT